MACPTVEERCPFCETFVMVWCAMHTPLNDVARTRTEHLEHHVEEMIEA